MNGVLLLVSLALLVGISFAAIEECGSTGRGCVDGQSSCVDGQCVCNDPNDWGNPAFACYKPNTYVAEIFNDPQLRNFNNESVQFPYPCRYLATHFISEMNDKESNVIGSCELMVHAFNAKSRGKFYLHGFDVALHIKYSSGSSIKMSSRHYGRAKYGDYLFKNSGTTGQFYQNGPWGSDRIKYSDRPNGIRLDISKNADKNRLTYAIESCGVRMTFVPYDVKHGRSQPLIPGISIAVSDANNPRWLSNDDVMALAPALHNGALFKDKKIYKIGVEESIFIRAFKRDYVNNMPMQDRGKCDAGHNAFRKCTRAELRNAMKYCYWMLKEPRFIYCMDKSRSARKILRLFSTCIRIWCAGTPCSKAQDMIVKAGCDTIRDIPEVPEFISGDMCPQVNHL